MTLQWYPGHMAKTRRLMKESLKHCDIIVELIDARIPYSSRNPDIDNIIENKPRMVLINKSDISDPSINDKWLNYYKNKGIACLLIDCMSGRGIDKFYSMAKGILKDKIDRESQKGMEKAIKAMIVGIPNVGKSSFINRIAGGKKAKVEDRPGVTRGKQWIRTSHGLELLDMPGILWPKFEDKDVGLRLGFTGAIKDDIIDVESLSCYLLERLTVNYKKLICERYKIEDYDDSLQGYEILELICKKRGFLISRGEVDYLRGANMVLDEFRGCKIGKISLESPEDIREGI
ncbi:MAG: ribosome biogenesis GTPase YlqF [Clostridia bacterium]|nr:ribosome biogenesis GTPase YlqF [Clostridia bacterium]